MTDSTSTENPRSPIRKWSLRILLFLFFWVIIFFVVFGPGRVLFPSLLDSYENVTDNVNTVYYSGDHIMEAMDVLYMASIVQDSIRKFWNDTSDKEFWKGVNIFLCESPDQYYHLTWNKAMGSAMMGRIVLNPDRFETTMSLYSALVHEMSHLYMSRRFGYFCYVFLFPKWFDEGCATVMQDYSFSANHLNDYLRENPELVLFTSLKHPWNWQAMVRMEDGKMAAKGYGSVYQFTRYLISNYGIDPIREYGSRLHWNFRSENTFEEVFQVPLATIEKKWLAQEKESGNLPAKAQMVPVPFDFLVFFRWVLIFVVVLAPIVIIGRLIYLKFFRK